MSNRSKKSSVPEAQSALNRFKFEVASELDVEEPNVFRNLFPYEEIPKIAFNDRIVPHNMPEDIWITDTTFRDGQQSRAPYTTEQIVTIYDYLHKLGGPKGKIRQSEFFLYSKKDRDAVYKCLERGYNLFCGIWCS